MSIRQAALKAGLSEGRWRQIESGYATPSPGLRVPVIAPAETLARMAHAVGVTEAELTRAGREDAALALADMPATTPGGVDPTEAAIEADPYFLREEKDTMLSVLKALRAARQHRDVG